MDIVERFISKAHSDPFTFKGCRLKMESNKNEIIEFLHNSQEGTRPSEYRIKYEDIERAIESAELQEKSTTGLIVKIVVQKANMHIAPASTTSGYWANLAFLYRIDSSDGAEWLLYGYGKGRFKKSRINLKKGACLGYSLFSAISEKNHQISESFADKNC